MKVDFQPNIKAIACFFAGSILGTVIVFVEIFSWYSGFILYALMLDRIIRTIPIQIDSTLGIARISFIVLCGLIAYCILQPKKYLNVFFILVIILMPLVSFIAFRKFV